MVTRGLDTEFVTTERRESVTNMARRGVRDRFPGRNHRPVFSVTTALPQRSVTIAKEEESDGLNLTSFGEAA